MEKRNYIRMEIIGGGGFADVWRAVLEGTTQEYALKMLRDYRDPDARHRFEREVKMLQGLRHPRVIQLIEANVTAEIPFYVMPLMRGGALTAWAGQLPPESLRTILVQLMEFLSYLHAQGGLHRDIKPDNLLVDAVGNFAVGDFGLGNNPRYTVMMTAHAVGTWGYIAPELTQPGAKATPAADVYSAGATIFHLATGLHPKDAHTLDPWTLRPNLPAELREAILQMVRVDPRTRPSAQALLAALSPRPKQDPKKSSSDGVKFLVGLGFLAVMMIAALSD